MGEDGEGEQKAVAETKKMLVGFFCILAKRKTSALEVYNGLRIHSSQAMDVRLFIQFIALVQSSKSG